MDIKNILVVTKGRGLGEEWSRNLGSADANLHMNLSKLWETVEDRGAWHAAVHGIAKSWV